MHDRALSNNNTKLFIQQQEQQSIIVNSDIKCLVEKRVIAVVDATDISDVRLG